MPSRDVDIDCDFLMPHQQPTGTTLSADGVELFVRQRGKGRPLLLINGLGGTVEMLEALEERLAAVAHDDRRRAPGAGRRRRRAARCRSRRSRSVLSRSARRARPRARSTSSASRSAGRSRSSSPTTRRDRVRRLALAGTACGWGSVPGTLEALALISMPIRYHSRTLYERTARLLGPADRDLLRRVPGLSRGAPPPSAAAPRLRVPARPRAPSGRASPGSRRPGSDARAERRRRPARPAAPTASSSPACCRRAGSTCSPARGTSSSAIPRAARCRCSRTSSPPDAHPLAAPGRPGRRSPTTRRSRPPSRPRAAPSRTAR